MLFEVGWTEYNLYDEFIGGDTDFVVGRLNGADGRTITGVQQGSKNAEQATCVTVTQDGYAYVGGWTDGQIDIIPPLNGQRQYGRKDNFVIKYDSMLRRQWVRVFGTDNDDMVHGMYVSKYGILSVVGSTQAPQPTPF